LALAAAVKVANVKLATVPTLPGLLLHAAHAHTPHRHRHMLLRLRRRRHMLLRPRPAFDTCC